MTTASKQGPRSLEDQLTRIAADELIVDLESAYQKAARPGAESLIRRAAIVTARTIPDLDDPKEMAAVAAALHLRTVDLLDFWEPLLIACKSGQSTAPLRDLRTASKTARTLQALLETRKPSKARDAVLQKATEAAERVEDWLPAGKTSSATATRYARGAFDEDEEEGGAVKVRPPPDPKARKERPESPLRRILGWALTVVALVGMGFGAWQVVQKQTPKPRDAAYFNSLIFEVDDKRVEPDAVVFTMAASWLTKPREAREADLSTLHEHLEREGVDALRVVDRKGGVLASVDVDGAITWQREKLNAGEMLTVGDVERDPIGEVEAAPPTPEPGPEGDLAKPMTAEELRRASSP